MQPWMLHMLAWGLAALGWWRPSFPWGCSPSQLANCGGLPLSKSGLTSAPRLPQPAQTKRGSTSDKRTSSDQHTAQAHRAHLAEGDLHRPAVGVRRRMALCRARHAAIKAAS